MVTLSPKNMLSVDDLEEYETKLYKVNRTNMMLTMPLMIVHFLSIMPLMDEEKRLKTLMCFCVVLIIQITFIGLSYRRKQMLGFNLMFNHIICLIIIFFQRFLPQDNQAIAKFRVLFLLLLF